MDAIAEQLLARLRSDPRDRDAFDALRAHYVHGQDFVALADLLESWALSHPDDRIGSSDAWTEAADAVLQAGGDRTRAKVLYRRALELNVLHPRAGDRLRELLETDTDFQGLIEVLEPYARALETAGGSPVYIAGLYQRLSELWQHAFARPDLAASYEARASALRSRPSRPSTSTHEDPRTRAQQLQQRVEAETVPARRANLLSELARLKETQLHDVEGALEALREARNLAPSDILIMHQLATLLLEHAPRGDVQAARVAQRRACELLYQIAQAVHPSEALPYLESALSACPDHEGALSLLERLAPEQDRADVLPAYWVRFLAAAGDGPETDQRRIWLGRAYLRSDQLEDAIYCLQPAALHQFEGAEQMLQEAYARLGADASDGVVAPPMAPAALDTAPAEPPPEPKPRAPSGIAELRKAVRSALSARRGDEAAEYCRSILALDPNDGEAFNLLESHLRKRGDYPALKNLLLSSTRNAGLALEARRARLREIATLCEGRLRDLDTALDAWREVVTLDPGDREAISHLKRLLERTHGWDELAAVLEREALATTEATDKVARLRELLQLQRERRKDVEKAAEVLRRLHALEPQDAAIRSELCELLLALERWSESVPLLRECIAGSAEDLDELRYSHKLAEVLHEKLHAYDEAYRACAQILEFKPNDQLAFERMESVDADSGNSVRLLSTLERRALLATKSERPALLLRMADIADQRLDDLERAAAYLGEALDLTPDDDAALQHTVDIFERKGRFERLVQLLWQRVEVSPKARTRASILRRVAVLESQRLHDDEAAADAYQQLLTLEEDRPALQFLRDHFARREQTPELVQVLQRLANCSENDADKRDLLLERAVLLHERLGALPEAISTLREILEQLDGGCESAIDLLASLSERSHDPHALALALERRLDRAIDPAERLPLLKRLADLYEVELAEPERAVDALQRWTREDAHDPAPYRRLHAILPGLERWNELLPVLDALAAREGDASLREQAVLEAARLCCDRLGDVPGGWRRLLPLIEAQRPQAVELLHDITERHGRYAELAALYVRLAQQVQDPAQQGRHWMAAAETFEHRLRDPAQALEASLRLLATDLGNRDYLGRVDRLAVETKAFRRLTQVYDRLTKQASGESEQLTLLLRVADLLEPEQPEDALDRVVTACKLVPLDDQLLGRAEALAQRTHRSDELLPLYDRRCEHSLDDSARLHVLLRAARLCDAALRDREQAIGYLRRATELVVDSPELGSELESVARELDRARPELGADSARRALVLLYREAASRAGGQFAEQLLLRAAQLLQHELGDEHSAFDTLLHGSALLPDSESIYDTVRAMASTRGRLDAIDAQLSRMLEDATDMRTTVAVLRRRGTLLEDPLARYQDAAAVYSKLAQLTPDDAHAAERLRVNLRRSGRYQELLAALTRRLERTSEPASRVALLKEIAGTWETDLKNRWEALDAWKAVLELSADDPDAAAGIARLSRGASGDRTRRPDSTQSFARAPSGPRSEVVVRGPARTAETPRPKPPPQAGGSGRPHASASSGRPEAASSMDPDAVDDDVEADDEGIDDLAALDAAMGTRVDELDELDPFDAAGDLEVGKALPLPPTSPATRGSAPGRLSPPPTRPDAAGPPPLPGRSRPPRPLKE